MINPVFNLITTFAFALFGASDKAPDPEWVTDFEVAKKLAAEQKKDLYVNFTGSDW